MPTSEVELALFGEPTSSTHRRVTFVGGSPAWGDAVERAAEAVPEQYRRLASSSGDPVNVRNLTCNGQLVGDSYFLANAAARQGADTVFVQVTYHNFSPRGRDGARQRYPELPSLVGVPVTGELAEVLGIDPTPNPDVSGAIDRWLRGSWRLYAERDRIAARTLGAAPETHLHATWDRWLATESSPQGATPGEPDADGGASGTDDTSYLDLDPGMQSVMADEWATDADFTLSADDSECQMLRALCEDLRDRRIDVVVYLAPINLQALSEMGMLDEQRYRANVLRLRSLVERTGATFSDLNEPRPLPPDAFVDINHTTIEGCRLTAERLLALTPPPRRAGR